MRSTSKQYLKNFYTSLFLVFLSIENIDEIIDDVETTPNPQAVTNREDPLWITLTEFLADILLT